MDPLPLDDGDPLVSFAVEDEHLIVTASDDWALRLPLGLEVAEATRRLERFFELCSAQPPHPGGQIPARASIADSTHETAELSVRRELAHPN